MKNIEIRTELVSLLLHGQRAAEQLPQVLVLLAGQVVHEAGKVLIPGLLGGLLEHGNLVELFKLGWVEVSVGGHPDTATLLSVSETK